MQIFLGAVTGNNALVEEEEAKHAIKVLRKKQGDVIAVIDGLGTLYHCTITEIFKQHLYARVNQTLPHFGAVPYNLHMAIAPTKNIDRLEWFAEKATEMGISAIYPIITQHSERTKLKPERLEKILLSATKQSLKAAVPKLHPLQKFTDFINLPFDGQKYIAHCYDLPRQNFFEIVRTNVPTLVCIGPEGDFSEAEVALAEAKNFIPVRLGESRLRTETAALAAVAGLYAKV